MPEIVVIIIAVTCYLIGHYTAWKAARREAAKDVARITSDAYLRGYTDGLVRGKNYH